MSQILPNTLPILMYMVGQAEEPADLQKIINSFVDSTIYSQNNGRFANLNARAMIELLATYATHDRDTGEPPKLDIHYSQVGKKFQHYVRAEQETAMGVVEPEILAQYSLKINDVMELLKIPPEKLKSLHVPGWFLRDTQLNTSIAYKQKKDEYDVANLTVGHLYKSWKQKAYGSWNANPATHTISHHAPGVSEWRHDLLQQLNDSDPDQRVKLELRIRVSVY